MESLRETLRSLPIIGYPLRVLYAIIKLPIMWDDLRRDTLTVFDGLRKHQAALEHDVRVHSETLANQQRLIDESSANWARLSAGGEATIDELRIVRQHFSALLERMSEQTSSLHELRGLVTSFPGALREARRSDVAVREELESSARRLREVESFCFEDCGGSRKPPARKFPSLAELPSVIDENDRAMRAAVQTLRQDFDCTLVQLSGLRDGLNKLDPITSAVENLNARLAAAEKRIEDLQVAAQVPAALRDAEAQLEQTRAELGELRDTIQSLDDRLPDLDRRLNATADAGRADAETLRQALTSEVAAFRATIQPLDERFPALEQKLSNDISEGRREVGDLRSRVIELQDARSAFQRLIEENRQISAVLRSQIGHIEGRISEIQRGTAETSESGRAAAEVLREDITKVVRSAGETVRRLAELERTAARRTEIPTLRGRIDQLEVAIRRENDDLQHAMTNLAEDLPVFQQRLDALERSVKREDGDLRQRLRHLAAAIQVLRQSIETAARAPELEETGAYRPLIESGQPIQPHERESSVPVIDRSTHNAARRAYRILTPAKLAAMGSTICLNIGCETSVLPDHLNVDSYEAPGVDLIADLDNLPFANGSVKEIHFQHVLERYAPGEIKNNLLPHWIRLLKDDGILSGIAVDAEHTSQHFAAGACSFNELSIATLGEADAQPRRSMFSRSSLRALLAEAGLERGATSITERQNGEMFELEIKLWKRDYPGYADRNGRSNVAEVSKPT